MQNVSGARGFLSMKWFTKGEILHPVLILIYIGVLVRKQYVQKFLALSKNVPPPLITDNEKGSSGVASRKIDNIFIEGKDDILLSCKQIS